MLGRSSFACAANPELTMQVNDTYRVPVGEYVASLSESFPRPRKERVLNTGFEKRVAVVAKPISATNEGFGGEGYLEFHLAATPSQFTDLSNIQLELTGHIVKDGGAKVKAAENVQLTNLPLCSLFRTVSVFLNGVQVECGTNFGYSSYIRTMINTPDMRRGNLLELMGYQDTLQEDKFTDDSIARVKQYNV